MRINEVINFLNKYNSYVILPHKKADGDAIGSCIALSRILDKLNKKNYIYYSQKLPNDILFLNKENILSKRELYIPEAVITLDSADIFRVDDRIENFKNLSLLNIDHHLSNSYYGDTNWVKSDISSTGEMIYLLLKEMNIDIDEIIADALYTAIITDTGRLLYQNTKVETYLAIADLVKNGARKDYINRMLYSSNSLNKLKLESFAINNIKSFYEGKLMISVIDRKVQEKFNCYNLDNIVEVIRDIKDVEVSVLIYDYFNKTQVSFRSKKDINVSDVARVLGGGGHKNAAGASFNIIQDKSKIIDVIIEELSELQN